MNQAERLSEWQADGLRHQGHSLAETLAYAADAMDQEDERAALDTPHVLVVPVGERPSWRDRVARWSRR